MPARSDELNAAADKSEMGPARPSVPERMRAAYRKCRAELHDLELWRNYYLTRYLEMRSVAAHWPVEHSENILEIGCGVGYVSVLLSSLTDKVYATDLPEADTGLHAVGLRRTNEFLARTDVTNVESHGVDAQNMPFEDESFDVIYSMFVMQHIPDRTKSVAEMHRVLRAGGYMVHLVPNRRTLVYGFLQHYVYLFKRTFVHLYRIIFRVTGSGGRRSRDSGEPDTRSVSDVVKSSGQFKNFPFQPVLGSYESNADEWRASGSRQWKELLTANGEMKVVKQVSIKLNPIHIVTGLFSSSASVALFRLLRPLDLFLGRLPILKHLGVNYLFVIQKPPCAGA